MTVDERDLVGKKKTKKTSKNEQRMTRKNQISSTGATALVETLKVSAYLPET